MPKKKGSKVQGRAKQKVKAQGASSGGKPPWMKKFARSFDDDSDDNDGPTFRGFAQRSGQSTPARDPGLKLRHQAISFVSAGTNTPIEKEVKEPKEEEIVAALVGDDVEEEEEGIEDSAMQDTMVDDVDDSTTLEATMVTDTDVEISKGTKAMHIHEHTHEAVEPPIAALDGAADPLPDSAAVPLSKPPAPPQETLPFVIDTEGDPSLSRPAKTKPEIPARPASPTPSDSSEEVILFHGRNKPKVVDDPIVSSRNTSIPQQPPKPPAHKQPVQKAPSTQPTPQRQTNEAHVTDELLAALLGDHPARQAPTSTEAHGWGAKPPKWDQQVQSTDQAFTPAPPGSWWKNKGVARPDLDLPQAEKLALDAAAPRATKVAFAAGEEEENGAEETIASLQAEWDRTRRQKKQAKRTQQAQQQEDDDGFEDIEEEDDVNAANAAKKALALDLGMKTSRRGKRGRKRSNKLLRDLQSDQTDDDEAAYNDYMENLKAQLEADEELDIPSIRTAEGGPSMVVNGQAIDEADVMDQATRQANFDELRMMDTDSESDDDEIGQDVDDFEDDDEDASDFDSTDLEEELEYNEREQWEDEDDLRQRRLDAMDDETLARLWAKQAEMGISDDDLVIDDGTGMDVDDLDGFGDLDDARAGLASLANSSFGQTSKRSSNKKRGDFNFPNASALADTVDQYGDAGFDIMDFDRPSLRPKRGKKSKMPPELEALSDDELRDEVLGQWSNDRDKKRLKKAEREELRMQGLLGSTISKKGKADLGQKYLQGMTIPQVHDELRIFLQDDGKTTRSFPPMDKEDRKALHEIANALSLKSKSIGTGKNRSPVLYKTSRTPSYSDATFRRVTSAANRGFLKNSAFKGKKPKGGAVPRGGQKGGKGRGADTSSTGLRHGDVVGGGAKEIGRENFGHRLMEKMGWQKGTALGKEGSSGLLTPVEQVMRTGRSGLG